MPFNFLNQGQTDDAATRFQPIDTFIDPVSKIRVSNPGNLIDTDFEYGLQPTKWETVEIINNTPAFFSKSGDTTISDITGVTTNAGTREITVTTAFPHLLDVGIPIRVAGTKSLTADGSYIINATPTPTTFTYLSRANQTDTVSIFDLYTSIITGEFFQGSQISISDSEGITTDGLGPNSTLTVKTSNKHGFGPNTPFYFLNLNSTVSQEFEAQNSTSLSFDPTNSATAQTFDGSNTLIQTPVDLSNSASTSIYQNTITSTSATDQTITVSIASGDEPNWSILRNGDPLYYSVNIGSGYFQANPRGVVFIKDVSLVDTDNNTATFQVSVLPDDAAIPVLNNMTGFFQVADQAKTFAGNNVGADEITISVLRENAIEFDGSNTGYPGVLDADETPPSVTGQVTGYSGSNILLFTAEGSLDYYIGAMLKYETDGTAPAELENGASYFVTAFSPGPSGGLFNLEIAELPGESSISFTTTGAGSQTFTRIGVAVDKNIIHIKDANFAEKDMLEYVFPEAGRITYDTDEQKQFFFVETAYDAHNYALNDSVAYVPLQATGGDVVTTVVEQGREYNIHQFYTPGTSTFNVTSEGSFDEVEVYVIGGGGSGANGYDGFGGGGGGGGGMAYSIGSMALGSHTVTVGAGGARPSRTNRLDGSAGGTSSFSDGVNFTLSATGGARGDSRAGGGVTAAGGTGSGGQVNGTGGSGGQGGGSNRGSSSGGPGGNGVNGAPGGGGGGDENGNTDQTDNRGGNGDAEFFTGGGAGGGGDQNNSANVGGLGGTGYFNGGDGGGNNGNAEDGFGPGGGAGGISGTSRRNNGGGGGSFGGGGGGAGDYTNSGGSSGGGGGNGAVFIKYPVSERGAGDATGGSITTEQIGTAVYNIHTFGVGTTTFTVTNDSQNNALYEVYVVGGGGGGSIGRPNSGSPGGAGGGFTFDRTPIDPGSYTVVVGAGGDGGQADGSGNSGGATGRQPVAGGDSSLTLQTKTLLATGGGFAPNGSNARPSGGVGSGGIINGTGGYGGSGGDPSSNGESGGTGSNFAPGGGGGSANNGTPGNGGNGSSDYFTGGGGGGARDGDGSNGASGNGGTGYFNGGRGSNVSSIQSQDGGGPGGGQRGELGTNRWGSGGGGGSYGGGGGAAADSDNSRNAGGGAGGDGVVIIRYYAGEA